MITGLLCCRLYKHSEKVVLQKTVKAYNQVRPNKTPYMKPLQREVIWSRSSERSVEEPAIPSQSLDWESRAIVPTL